MACSRARVEKCVSDIKEDSLAASLESDVESISIRFDSFCNQRRPPLSRDECQNSILCVRRLIFKIQSCDQPRQHSAREHTDGKMRSLQRSIRSRHTPGDDGLKREFSAVAGGNSSESVERRIERPILSIGVMSILPGCICLPHLDERIRHRVAVPVAQRSLDDDVASR